VNGACCDSDRPCVFSKALLARAAVCERAQRRSVGEREVLECGSQVAHTNCSALAALMRERARFALRLPPVGQLLIHVQAMRLQCGGLRGLQQALQAGTPPDVHAMVLEGRSRHGSLTALPWDTIVDAMRAWTPRRRLPPS